MAWRPMLGGIVLDLGLWLIAPLAFLFLYTRSSSAGTDAVLAHLRLVLLAWSCLALVRLASARLVPGRRFARGTSALLVSAAITTMLLYYAAVWIGLESWGRVISWDLIRSYAIHAPALTDALGLSFYAVAAVVVAAYAAAFAAAWMHAGRFGWITRISRVLTPRMLALVLVAGAIACGAEIYRFQAFPPLRQKEPLSLTLFPFGAAMLLQNVAIDPMRAERLDALEDAARADYRPSASAVRRNVVLIVVDALRADRMGVYGYSRGTTPNLDRMAAAGALRKSAQIRSVCTASVCGLVSLLTSKFVHEFSARPVSLHEILKLHGYRTQMILSGDHQNFYGLKQLFGPVDDYYDGSIRSEMYANDDRLVLERVAELPSWDGVPVFMQFHLMSTHILGRRHKQHSPFSPAASYVIPANRYAPLVDNFYDNGVTQADAVIHQALGTLREKGYLMEALVVITADHGESLGEGGRYSHAQGVNEEALRIPLLLIAYGYRPPPVWREGTGASQVDIAPTIIEELGMAPVRTWSGVALQTSFARAYTYYQEAYAAGLIDHRDPRRLWKYWVDSKRAREHAYDLTADPGERLNVIAAVPESLKREWRLEYLRFQPGGTGQETIFMH